jgi:hypothetical protein
MASQIAYKDQEVPTNNMQFSRLIDFVIQVGRMTARSSAEERYVDRMSQLQETEFWPGRGIQIEDDFPDIEEQKFWARVFLDTAREIFDRRIGIHEHSFWQAQCIWQAYGAGQLQCEHVIARWRNLLDSSIIFDICFRGKPTWRSSVGSGRRVRCE